jgi:hypothetical protein
MKKMNLLSKDEMRKVIGGILPESYCSESEYYAHCDISIPLEQGGWSYGSFEGCIEKSNYDTMAANPNNKCRILGIGGPYEL